MKQGVFRIIFFYKNNLKENCVPFYPRIYPPSIIYVPFCLRIYPLSQREHFSFVCSPRNSIQNNSILFSTNVSHYYFTLLFHTILKTYFLKSLIIFYLPLTRTWTTYQIHLLSIPDFSLYGILIISFGCHFHKYSFLPQKLHIYKIIEETTLNNLN